jgi:hypothetical protein
MAWKKGVSGNVAGRPKGSQNKAGSELRQKISDFLSGHFATIVADFDEMEPRERVRLFIGLLPYCIGKKQDLTIDGKIDRMSDDELDEIIESLKPSS